MSQSTGTPLEKLPEPHDDENDDVVPVPPNDGDLLRGFGNEHEEDIHMVSDDEEGNTHTTTTALLEEHNHLDLPKFQPGDHVIRWKMIKVMLWPIQIHGIVMSSEVKDDGSCSVVIADFGYSSSEDEKKKKGFRGNLNLANINGMMKGFYDGNHGNHAKQQNHGNGTGTTPGSTAPPHGRDADADADDEEEDFDKEDGKRFHLRTITDPKILKKWSKVNYGQSLFSSKGKFDKLKKLFKLPNKKSSPSEDHDDSSKVNDENTIQTSQSATSLNSSDDAIHQLFASDSKEPHDHDLQQSDSLEELMAQANDVDRKSRSKSGRSFLRGGGNNGPSNISNDSNVSVTSKKSLPFKPPSFKGVNNFMKKLNLQKHKHSNEEYDTIPSSASAEENEKKNSSKREEPKLPKSDPRTIVVARVKFILAEQDKSEEDSALPKYHIFYSNSECLAVWCKTGRFSTLQAAVFLHSTAVGNAKSSFLLGTGVAATQPWLIPVVGVYAVAAVGMPYYILNKCKNKWKEGEMRLTHGFWQTADTEVFVSAVQNWSGLCPEDEEDSDEIETTGETTATILQKPPIKSKSYPTQEAQIVQV